ncbi:hypothetical protein L3X38_031510 [Prunus dulcis]|uniref:Uncharacterized protein n=1 Tax=Prunus dulcis TaxID=3755 RepID=A0AAD4VDC3_PRUDU|nr:hypothetical protein L3X38_031510 [Prunus dulcis]
MGEQNRYNAAGVNDEEAYLDSGFSRSDWNPKITVGQIFSSKKALLTELRLTALRGHFEFKEASWELTGFGVVGTPKLSELEARAIPKMGDHPGKLLLWKLRRGLVGAHWLRVRRNSEVKRVGGLSNPRMGDHPGKLLRELPGTNPCGTLSSGPRADNIVLRRSRSGV